MDESDHKTSLPEFMNASGNSSSRINPEVHLLILLALFYGFASIYMPRGGGDTNFWQDWTAYIYRHGIRHIYDLHTHPAPGRPPSFLYGPVYMYLLYFFVKWQGGPEVIQYNIHQIKILILAFDVVGIWFALRYLQDKVNRPFYALFFLFNIGLLYDTIDWGQVDGAIACLTLMAVYFALRQQLALSGISFIMGLLIKPQPIIFLPVIGLLWLSIILRNPVKYTVVNSLAVVLVTLILLFPFLQAGTFMNYWAMLLDTPNVYNTVTINAANLWNLILNENPNHVSDELIRFGLSYKQWGLLMFSISYFVILFPLLTQFYQITQGQRTHFDTTVVLLIAGLVPIIFYFFNTQMHERYAHSCVLILGAYAVVKGDFVPYLIASIANFCVMEKYLRIFDLPSLHNSITLKQLALLFLFTLVWGIVKLYKNKSSYERVMA